MSSSRIADLAERIGRFCLFRLRFIAGVTELLLHSWHALCTVPTVDNGAIRSVLLRQVYFTGLQAWKIVVALALIVGAVIVSQVVSIIGSSNATLIGKLLVWVVLRELGPLLTALIVIARSGTAIAAELGSMKINGELASLELLGIPYERYLIMPRVIGAGLAVIVLTFYFICTSFAGGLLIATTIYHLSYDQVVRGIAVSLALPDVVMLICKSITFGIAIPAICCQAGLGVGTSATEIPQAATRAVIASLFGIFLIDGLIAVVASVVS